MIVIATRPRPSLPPSPPAHGCSSRPRWPLARPLFSPPLPAIDINTDVLCGNTIRWFDAGAAAGLRRLLQSPAVGRSVGRLGQRTNRTYLTSSSAGLPWVVYRLSIFSRVDVGVVSQ